jgi:lysophospholipase L1-like esterase
MRAHGIEIVDANAAIGAIGARAASLADGVHLNADAASALGRQVAERIGAVGAEPTLRDPSRRR